MYYKAARIIPAADKYIRSIRKPVKKEYALAYADWLEHGGDYSGVDSPETPEGLGYLGAQAIRMQLTDIYEQAGRNVYRDDDPGLPDPDEDLEPKMSMLKYVAHKLEAVKMNVLGPNQTVLETTTEDGDREVFFSYNTPVAVILYPGGVYVTEQRSSNTTSRHITKFLQSRGRDKSEAKVVPQAEIEAMAEGKKVNASFGRSAIRTSEDRFYKTTLTKIDNQTGERIPTNRFSYESGSALYDVDVTEDGTVSYAKNSRPSEKEKHHDVIMKHFNISGKLAQLDYDAYKEIVIFTERHYLADKQDWWENAPDDTNATDEPRFYYDIFKQLDDTGSAVMPEEEAGRFYSWAQTVSGWTDSKGHHPINMKYRKSLPGGWNQ